ncbi:MAG: helix-turn-helix transcriptional regulator [Lewinellaceae bacterium]|nr:helix-turn-helix transcriptional regulator [Saprospiraceae bacterium]MCB9341740.1 helix-turn-helix transcriptional regulator [Lewinellaceae bacterium]
MKLFIKNMVCDRCKMMVRQELAKAGVSPETVELGEISFPRELTPQEIKTIGEVLTPLGFEMIDDRRSRLIEQIKKTIIELVHYTEEMPKVNLSVYLSQKLHYEYSHLSNLFSAIEGITLEKYFIAQKIERVKELLVYDELTLSEIAHRMGYSSVAYLSGQFKKVTGLTPSYFKSLKLSKRTSIDKVAAAPPKP